MADKQVRNRTRLDEPEALRHAGPSNNAERHLSGMLRLGIFPRPQTADYDWILDYPTQQYNLSDINRMLERLSPRQVTYTVALLCGITPAGAQKQFGIPPTLGEQWQEAPWFPTLVQRERDRMFGMKKAAFDPMTPLAVARLEEELLGQHGDDIAHDAAKYVLEQRFGKAAPTTPEGETTKEDGSVGGLAGAFVDFIQAATRDTEALAAQQHEALTAEVREITHASGE